MCPCAAVPSVRCPSELGLLTLVGHGALGLWLVMRCCVLEAYSWCHQLGNETLEGVYFHTSTFACNAAAACTHSPKPDATAVVLMCFVPVTIHIVLVIVSLMAG